MNDEIENLSKEQLTSFIIGLECYLRGTQDYFKIMEDINKKTIDSYCQQINYAKNKLRILESK